METAQLGFKKPLSKDEKIEKKKQRLAAIGNSCSVILYIYEVSHFSRFNL